MAKKLFVGNLPQGCTSQDLRNLFETIGQVVECDVLKNYGFVHMSTIEEALEAVNKLGGHRLYGNAIRVQHSTSVDRKEPGGGGGKGRGRGGRGGRGGGRGGGSFRGGEGGGRGGFRGGRGGGRDRAAADYKDRDYYGDYSRRPPPPDPYYDRYYEDYYRRPPPYPYPPYSRDPYSRDPYRARSRSPPPGRRPVTPPRYRRRGDSPPLPPRDYYDYPGGDRYADSRSQPSAQNGFQTAQQLADEAIHLIGFPTDLKLYQGHLSSGYPTSSSKPRGSPRGHPAKASSRVPGNHGSYKPEV